MTFTVSASEDVVTMRIPGGLEKLSLVPGVEMEDILTFSISIPAGPFQRPRSLPRRKIYRQENSIFPPFRVKLCSRYPNRTRKRMI